MKSNKVLFIRELAFNLPDDFTGDIHEALTEMLKYHLSDKAKQTREIGDETIPNTQEVSGLSELWDKDTSKLFYMGVLMEYTDKWRETMEIKDPATEEDKNGQA
jgi:hypothetical protein